MASDLGYRAKSQPRRTLKQKGSKRGVASLCIGGGEATAVAVELV